MAIYKQGVNIRQNFAHATDGVNEWWQGYAATNNYPATSTQGNILGFTSGDSFLRNFFDRTPVNGDRRLAGFCGNYSSLSIDVEIYQLDIPAPGKYLIQYGSGDTGYVRPSAVDLYDDTTLLAHLVTGSTGGGNHYKDASNTDRASSALWTSNYTSALQQFTFASTKVIFKWPYDTWVTHLYVEQVPATIPLLSHHYRMQTVCF